MEAMNRKPLDPIPKPQSNIGTTGVCGFRLSGPCTCKGEHRQLATRTVTTAVSITMVVMMMRVMVMVLVLMIMRW